jgi:hypothetical protein
MQKNVQNLLFGLSQLLGMALDVEAARESLKETTVNKKKIFFQNYFHSIIFFLHCLINKRMTSNPDDA